MGWFMLSLFLHIVAFAVSTGQTDNEGDVFTRLDRLEQQLKESTEKLESVENELRTAKEYQAASDIKLAEAGDKILSLKNQLEERTTTGSTYVRWGRTTCPGNGTELVYAGFVGGSNYGSSGDAVNHLCLPKSPLYGTYNEDAEQPGGLVFGAVYELDTRDNGIEFFPGVDTVLQDHGVPCAVCRTDRSTVVMVPARYTCMDGWTLEYKGLLFSGNHVHAAANEYGCLDDRPESIPGRGNNNNGKQLFLVEGRCGLISCPPYMNGRELTCAVCSK